MRPARHVQHATALYKKQLKISKEAIVRIVEEEFDLRPKSLINMLDLKRPIYLQTAAYGHFGRSDIDLTWERTDKASDISQ